MLVNLVPTRKTPTGIKKPARLLTLYAMDILKENLKRRMRKKAKQMRGRLPVGFLVLG